MKNVLSSKALQLTILSLVIFGIFVYTNLPISKLSNKIIVLNDRLDKTVIAFSQAKPSSAGIEHQAKPSSAGIEHQAKPSSAGIEHQEFYIDPINGSASGDGSVNEPWSSLNDVISSGFIESQRWNSLPYKKDSSYLVTKYSGAPIKGGDTIYLMSGNYGDVLIQDYYNNEPITIKAYPGSTPVFDKITIRSCSNWTFDGITVLRTDPNQTGVLFSALEHGWRGPTSNITLKNSYISSGKNVSNWDADQWNHAASAIKSDGENFIAQNNTLENIGYGIDSLGDNALIENNTINKFSYDAIRGLGNYSTYQHNLIKNSIQTGNGAHDDGFQSWSRHGKPVIGSVVRGNTIIDYEDPNQPFSAEASTGRGLQGIGLFDGPFIDWTITDNTVIVNQYHGITVGDSKDTSITNNTVVARNYNGGKMPWILLGSKGRNGDMPITGNIISHNIVSSSVRIAYDQGVPKTGNEVSDNFTGSDNVTPDIFVDYDHFDLRLTEAGKTLFQETLRQLQENNIPTH